MIVTFDLRRLNATRIQIDDLLEEPMLLEMPDGEIIDADDCLRFDHLIASGLANPGSLVLTFDFPEHCTYGYTSKDFENAIIAWCSALGYTLR